MGTLAIRDLLRVAICSGRETEKTEGGELISQRVLHHEHHLPKTTLHSAVVVCETQCSKAMTQRTHGRSPRPKRPA